MRVLGGTYQRDTNKVTVDSDEVWNRYVEVCNSKFCFVVTFAPSPPFVIFVCILQANKDARAYRTKVVHNWSDIETIYSKDHANGAGARTGGECAQNQNTPVVEESPEMPQKRQRTGDAILCMMGQMRTSFDEALKTAEPLPMPKATPPTEILDALKKVEGLEDSDMLVAYGKLIVNERLFEALMALPENLRKPWLLTLP
jgi:hypothetical protein